jgi:cystathionine gamma-lyase
MLWLESPSNPTLEVYDIASLAEAAGAAGALCVVDNTTAGPLYQKALDLGADFALTSATKHLSGHSDLMLGYVSTRDAERAQALRDWRTKTGGSPVPSRSGSPTDRSRPTRCGSSAPAPARWHSPRCSPLATT